VPVGQRLLIPVRKGDPLLYQDLESSQAVHLAEEVSAKMRGYSLRVPAELSANQLVVPNDHVDVIGVFKDDRNRVLAKTLLENIIVLATGRTTALSQLVSEEEKRYTSVVLLVRPKDAEVLAVASATGTLSLSLRNPHDLAANGSAIPTIFDSLLAGEERPTTPELKKLKR
jgi:Flp pilus assembly protein CpaB